MNHEDVSRTHADTHLTHGNAKEKRQRLVQHATKPTDTNFVCTSNALDKRLRENGGTMRLGRRSECFKRGIGGGYYAKLPPDEADEFLAKWNAPYKKLIEQDLFYADGEAPHGRIPATLPQCVARGYAVGCKKKAEEILKHRRASHG